MINQEKIQRKLRSRIYEILNQEKTNHVHELIHSFQKDGTRSYYLDYETEFGGIDAKDGFHIYLGSDKISSYPFKYLIDASIVNQMVSDILEYELIARIMEVDYSVQGWQFTENLGMGIINPRGVKRLKIP